MNIRELTQYERRVFNMHRICPVCHREILDFDEFLMLKIRNRRRVYYNFIHKECENGKERIVWPISRRCQADC